MAKLTARQERFVDEYMIDLIATQAAIRAGYSAKHASNIASNLMGKNQVLEAIARRMALRSKRTGIIADRVLRELARVGFANITDVADTATVSVKEDADCDDTAAIQSIKVKTIPTDDGDIVEREIKMHDKLKALEQIGRHLGMWNDKLQLNATLNTKFDDIISQVGGDGLSE